MSSEGYCSVTTAVTTSEGFTEHSDESLDSIKSRGFLYQVNSCQLF